MKVTFLLTALFCIALPASAQVCGPDVKHSVRQLGSKSPLEINPPADKALVYFFAPKYEGSLQMKVSADRTWIGVNQRNTYFVAALDPGEHDFCMKIAHNASHLKLSLEAGKSYFLREYAWPPNDLREVTAEEAAVHLRKCKRSDFFVKN